MNLNIIIKKITEVHIMKNETTTRNFEDFVQRNYKKNTEELHNKQIMFDTSSSTSDEELNRFSEEINNEIIKMKNRDNIIKSENISKDIAEVDKTVQLKILNGFRKKLFSCANGTIEVISIILEDNVNHF
jgi:hypothetical protein